MCKKLRAIKQEIVDSNELKVIFAAHCDPYTYVHLCYKDVPGEGFAKRNPIDESDRGLGHKIAFGRALHEIAKQTLENKINNMSWYDLGKAFGKEWMEQYASHRDDKR